MNEKWRHSDAFGRKCPKLESIRLNVPYALSLNPPTLASKETNFLTQHNIALKYVRYINTIPDLTWEFYPEFADASSRLHLHGKIIFKTHLAVAHFWEAKAGWEFNYELDTIQEDYTWDYMWKQRDFMEPLCKYYKRAYILTPANTKTQKQKQLLNNMFIEVEDSDVSDHD